MVPARPVASTLAWPRLIACSTLAMASFVVSIVFSGPGTVTCPLPMSARMPAITSRMTAIVTKPSCTAPPAAPGAGSSIEVANEPAMNSIISATTALTAATPKRPAPMPTFFACGISSALASAISLRTMVLTSAVMSVMTSLIDGFSAMVLLRRRWLQRSSCYPHRAGGCVTSPTGLTALRREVRSASTVQCGRPRPASTTPCRAAAAAREAGRTTRRGVRLRRGVR